MRAGDRTTRTGLVVSLAPTGSGDVAELHRLFAAIVAADEGYPQPPGEPVSRADFEAYWLAPAVAGAVARLHGRLVGAYTMKPNGVGRAAHVANAGYVVAAPFRNRGIGELLVTDSLDTARGLGFDAMQFNLVFEDNPAGRLYERLGFEVVGRVPEVIEGRAVLLYWRRL
jgi:GNAT superfamily N-acetyltransferase